MTRLLNAARAYAELGWAVFPLSPGTKIPLLSKDQGGKGCHDATTDRAQIEAWWKRTPDANVGIHCGPASGIVVLDVDVPDPARGKTDDGDLALAALEAKHGPLPDTPWQRSGEYEGRRARQIIFKHFDGARNTANRIAPGLDTRAGDGYIVAPPSLHPSGVRYEWVVKPSVLALAAAPAWLVDFFTTRARETQPAPTQRLDWSSVPSAYVQRALDSEFREMACAGPGARNDRLNRGAFNLGQLVGSGALQRATAEQAVRAAAAANGWAQEEGPGGVEALIKSAIEAGMRAPRTPPEPTPFPSRVKRPDPPQTIAPPQAEPEPIVTAAEPASAAVVQLKPITQRAPQNDEDAWRDFLTENADGGMKRDSINNAFLMLTNMPETKGLFVFDDFRGCIMVTRRPPWALNGFEPAPLSDPDIAGARLWLERLGVSIKAPDAFAVIGYIAAQCHINPVRSYFAKLAWDGAGRLDTWMQRYLGAPDTLFVRQAGAKWMIGAVARVMHPGCKMDTMLILEGPQGLKKSSALACLATLDSERYFTDELAALGTKDAAQQLQGNLIVEMAELDALGRSDVKAIKAFLTRQIDKVRLPYARTISTLRRQCVFAGTVNPDGTGYLSDPTGGRRFWPVECTSIDIDALQDAREQLWAEAASRYDMEEPWWLTDEAVIAEAAKEQEDRREVDPLAQLLHAFLAQRTRVTSLEIMTECWSLPHRECDRRAEMRVAAALRAAGWKKGRRMKAGDRFRYWIHNDDPDL